MTNTNALIEHAQQVLASVGALQQTLDRLQAELRRHGEDLRRQLAGLNAPPSANGGGPASPPAPNWLENPGEPSLPGPADWIEPPDQFEFAAEKTEAPAPAAPAPVAKPVKVPVAKVADDERRSSLRLSGKPVSLRVRRPGSADDEFSCWVVDRSSGGLGIMSDENIAEGAVLSVRPTNAPEECPWIEVKVKYCKPEKGSWRIGCQFTHKMTWDKLRLFG